MPVKEASVYSFIFIMLMLNYNTKLGKFFF